MNSVLIVFVTLLLFLMFIQSIILIFMKPLCIFSVARRYSRCKRSTILQKMKGHFLFENHKLVKNVHYFVEKVHNFVQKHSQVKFLATALLYTV